jgi:DNA-binding winged helix-turn-helix (wHTH) protein
MEVPMELGVGGQENADGDGADGGTIERCSCPLCGSVLPVVGIRLKDGYVVANGASVRLSNVEATIFARLLKGYPGAVPRELIYQALVSGRSCEADWPQEKIIDVHISHIRGKLVRIGLKIETSYGFGFRLVEDVKVMEAAQ